MPFTFNTVDNEFAVSTGANVDAGPGTSTFDNPPNGSKDLVITTNEGDDDPRLFEIGDTYDVSWGGQIGGGTIEDAVVVRSDPAPDGTGSGIIVFEGLDENGDLAQVIWTPGFDLEGWYNDNYNPSAEPQFYTDDTNASYDHRFVCFASETRLRTPQGLKPVSALRTGDLVTTKDAGDVAVLWTGQRLCAATGENAPVVFERGSVGNTTTLRLSQQHRILVKSPLVQYYFGQNEVFVPAKACVNDHDIRIIPAARISYVHILLEKHHVVWAEGLECESLYLGDQTVNALYTDPEFQTIHSNMKASGYHPATARHVLKMKEAQLLMHYMRGSFIANDYPSRALDSATQQRCM